MNTACQNTDREIWRKRPGDFYSPSIHVTENGNIGINFGGSVIVAPVERWHAWGQKSLAESDQCIRKNPSDTSLLPPETRVVLHHYTPGFDGPINAKIGDTGTITSTRKPGQAGWDYFVTMDTGGTFQFNHGEVIPLPTNS